MRLVNKSPATKEQTQEVIKYLKDVGIEPGDFLEKYAPDLTPAQIKKLKQTEFDAKTFRDLYRKSFDLYTKLAESDDHQDLKASANLQYVLASAHFNANMIHGSIDELIESISETVTEDQPKTKFNLNAVVASTHKQLTEFLTYARNNKPIPF